MIGWLGDENTHRTYLKHHMGNGRKKTNKKREIREKKQGLPQHEHNQPYTRSVRTIL